MTNRLVTVFENPEGKHAYQPTLADGTRLYDDYTTSWMDEPPERVWLAELPEIWGMPKYAPVLFKSERRAQRCAEREQARRDKRARNAFTEVSEQ